MFRRILIVVGTAALLSPSAFAQSSDVDYCNKLSQAYRASIAPNTTPAAAVPEAMSKCATDPKGSIPVLEQALKDGKVALPSR
ncbi:hypothetical protein SAMN02745126_03816 [Enhydrobacter aerosaccus]|uniref:Uncharacterized protein n=1 Tax=Enhydrobacter aerosaccus TaxID=225324 RepID=A0A1T4RIF5_9HYPH|nr:hypothetical protein [Enhydrobacter aerosaccus]SKA15576.1 hypothetical protein SAMN02745126_03816 [Enhydrobacter aerosaccus]